MTSWIFIFKLTSNGHSYNPEIKFQWYVHYFCHQVPMLLKIFSLLLVVCWETLLILITLVQRNLMTLRSSNQFQEFSLWFLKFDHIILLIAITTYHIQQETAFTATFAEMHKFHKRLYCFCASVAHFKCISFIQELKWWYRNIQTFWLRCITENWQSFFKHLVPFIDNRRYVTYS